MPRLHVIVQRYVPRWVIEIALVAAAVQIYRQTLDLRSRVLNQPIVLWLAKKMPATSRARRIGYSILSLAVFVTAVWRWYILRKRLLRSDGAMDLAREAAATATSAVDKAADEIAEAQSHTSAAERELAACRLAIAEMQQALQRVEQEHKKEKRELALERVRSAAKLAAAADKTETKKSTVPPCAGAATHPTDSVELAHAAANVGGSVRRALMNIDQSNSAANARFELTSREDGSVDLRSIGVQQAFIKSFNSDLAQSRTGNAGNHRAVTDSSSSDAGLAFAEISEVDFTVTDAGELARVSFDLRYRQSAAGDFAGTGAAGRTAKGTASTVRDVE